MAFDISLYTIQKRNNSTKQPEGEAKTLSGVLRDSCDIINPVIGFSFAGPYDKELGRPNPMTAEFNPTDYNYAVIEEFKRSYYINSWEWSGGLWWAYMAVDVLGTYKEQIENHEFYITRAAADFDPDIIDTFYSSKILDKEHCIKKLQNRDSNLTLNFDEGTAILQVLGNDPAGNAGSYFIMSGKGLGEAINGLYPLSNNDIRAILAQTLGEAFVGGLSTIMSNIVDIKWLPIKYSYLERIQSTLEFVNTELIIGQWPTGLIKTKMSGYQSISWRSICRFDHRPDAERGNWLNLEPFSRYMIYVPPFGNFNLDSQMMVSHNYYVTVVYKLNLLNGVLTAELYYGDDNNDTTSTIHGIYSCDIAISIKTGGQTFDISSFAVDAAKSLAGMESPIKSKEVNAKVDGDPKATTQVLSLNLGPTAKAMAGIASAATHAQQVNSAGTNSNTLVPTFVDEIQKTTIYYDPTDDNTEEWGRPLFKRQTPAATGEGFILCAEGDIEIPGVTVLELKTIKEYMTAGWFYE